MVTILSGIFIASLAGSLHCAGMCGALASASCAGCRAARQSLAAVAACQAARGAAYAAAGAVAGSIGGAIDLGGALLGVQRLAGIAAGAAIIVAGTALLLRRRGVVQLTRSATPVDGAARPTRPSPTRAAIGAVSAIAARVRHHAAARAGKIAAPIPRAAMIGALSVMLPCGWLWAFLAVAAGTASSTAGALAMTAFWAGSVPILSAIAFGADRIGGLLRGRAGALMGAVMIALGAHMAWTAGTRGDALRLHREAMLHAERGVAAERSCAPAPNDVVEARLRIATEETPACCREETP